MIPGAKPAMNRANPQINGAKPGLSPRTSDG
jgi:hypothetical protein